ncbi:DUF3343 domain-containing protein [Alkaliphilus serpentinus]|uniref:DUF3343 domain-containing protein n=1 Tax=Alkaliphilus serpentinus TaxID=1482731 RepID=A0A833M7H1_9FIRM|nr:DUF3343 domain-containing protein [Alkaliphilus serpentinus]KAB3527637.1 DUF3343 domain-containing protein [Alkaliphilus serpentinus]
MRDIPNKNYYIAVFESRNHALHLYQHLNNKKLYHYDLVPTPCVIKAGCSYSIKFLNFDDYYTLEREATLIHKKIASLYQIESINGRRQISKIQINE